ncbi:hypothetical protein DVH24_002359, partial [Malus domestica]
DSALTIFSHQHTLISAPNTPTLSPKPRTCVVLGGRGFLGRLLVLRLLNLGKWIVRVADSTQSLHLDPSERDPLLSQALSSGRASLHGIDVRNTSQIITVIRYKDFRENAKLNEEKLIRGGKYKAIEGSSVVFCLDGADLPKDDFYQCYMIVVQGKSLLMKKQIRFCAMRVLEEEMVTFISISCIGAKNVISACRACKVRQLIYNSSAGVVFDASKDILNGEESLAYP